MKNPFFLVAFISVSLMIAGPACSQDPAWLWARSAEGSGGAGNEAGLSVVSDATGNVFVTGNQSVNQSLNHSFTQSLIQISMNHPSATDQFESFLEGQKSSLEVDFDEERVWMGISARMDRYRKLRRRLIALAASLTILLSAGLGILLYEQSAYHYGRQEAFRDQGEWKGMTDDAFTGIRATGKKPERIFPGFPAQDHPLPEAEPGLVSVEFGSETRLFRAAVEQKLSEVEIAGTDPALYSEVTSQLAQVDRHQARYMADLKEIGPDPRILRGIIRCYEQKIRILDKTLNRIERRNRSEPGPAQRII